MLSFPTSRSYRTEARLLEATLLCREHHEAPRPRRARRARPPPSRRLGRYARPQAPVSAPLTRAGLGHITTAYLASHFVSNTTEAYLKHILYNDTSDYLANIATWADSVRYTKWGRFTKTFHFIDAKDDPPVSCDVDLARDCKSTGCVVSSLANYTQRSLDPELSFRERNVAAKFVVHLVGDLHQPLHNEDVARGGNGIHVLWRGAQMNLHHVWDSSIAELLVNNGRRSGGKPFELAERWAGELVAEIEGGKFAKEREAWLEGVDLGDAEGTALAWSRECNAYVCTHGMSLPFVSP